MSDKVKLRVPKYEARLKAESDVAMEAGLKAIEEARRIAAESQKQAKRTGSEATK